MSWSISNVVGTPDVVVARLNAYGDSLTGDCKAEFDDAKPHIIGLVQQNRGPGVNVEIINAYGSASKTNGVETERVCSINMHVFHKTDPALKKS